jgi:hypothetical protein
MTDRSFGHVVDKLNEAQFYFHQFARSWDAEKGRFYFSAFASAARSVSSSCRPSAPDCLASMTGMVRNETSYGTIPWQLFSWLRATRSRRWASHP